MLKEVIVLDELVKVKIDKTTTLCHFFKDDEHNFLSLENDYIWFSELPDFNDPFDILLKEEDLDLQSITKDSLINFLLCNKGIIFNISGSDILYQAHELPVEALKAIVDEHYVFLSDYLKKYIVEFANSKRNMKFQCFSHNAEFEPVLSRLMWSHYASGMRGFAVEFHFDEILDSMSKINGNYFDGYTFINYVDLGFNEYIQSEIDNGRPLFVEQLIFAKHIDWQYEQEVRIISSLNKTKYESACISKVIIGGKMLDENKDKIISILEGKGLMDKLYLANFDRRDFSISLTKFSEF